MVEGNDNEYYKVYTVIRLEGVSTAVNKGGNDKVEWDG
jgi:hypothetical protein